jgi:iron complex outermembrane recepter protein
MHRSIGIAALTLALAATTALAQSPAALDPVVISVERSSQSSFNAAAAITAVSRDVIDSGGPQVNLSEALNRVPGISILNRQNYAQDLQLSIRGFGARSTFGIRGVRLIVDGIPATMPDGQGQSSNIDLGSASRIEVLRGPMAQLYGNAAGGVVQVVSAPDPGPMTVTVSAAGGPNDLNREAVRISSNASDDSVVLDASHFGVGGWREHSQARRDLFNAKWQHDYGPDTRLSLVANSLQQPLAQDPGGLTRADWEANPRQVAPVNVTQDARKTVYQDQIGAVLEHALSPATSLTARLYFGTRTLDNALSTPLGAQQSPTSSGGIVHFNRGYQGLGVQLSHAVALGEGRALRLTGGVEYDAQNDGRQGYIDNGGVAGALKRNERDIVDNRDAYAQAVLDFAAAWTATAGVRSSHVRFRTLDYFIVQGNPDDSGSVDYGATNPVFGLSFRAAPSLNLYANAGRGFETPTFTELAYSPTGSGLNFGLRASRSRHAEIGAKWKLGTEHRIDAAVYDIATDDELIVATNSGGRSTFRNAGRTSRRGIELQYVGRPADDWRATFSLSALRARFDDSITSGSGASAAVVAAGNRLPGTPERIAFAELAWVPQRAFGGFNAAAEVVSTGKLYVDDINSDAAPAATVLNLRAGFTQTAGAWKFTQLLRVDNATARVYPGSVIVNEANRRFFEPALPRNWLVALTAAYSMR